MTEGILIENSSGPDPMAVVVGPTFIGFREEVVKREAQDAVQASAIKVLDGALSYGPGSTGLVVGRVQSGKTLSYEGVICMARDNDFAVVVVISGISNPLLDQGERRLKRDLSKADDDGWLFLSPADTQLPSGYVEAELTRVRNNWRNPSTPKAYKQTAVIFLLKNYGRIRDLAETFDRVGLGHLRVLVVDDEADQASLNTLARRSRESSTFANIRALRDSLPNHFYLQYTATPQAPLLVAIQTALSPDYVRVLQPGHGYTGGEVYFEQSTGLVEVIGSDDLAAGDSPGGPPPVALRKAMQEFLLGAAHVVASGGRPETRSMLVHPSRERASQGWFASWIRAMRQNWQDKYDHASEVFPTKLRAEFYAAWEGLRQTHSGIADFEDCWRSLGLVFQNLDITEVNTSGGRTPVINWQSTKSYILVGGQAIDRGFTVEGLTVTYMPRGAGMSVADTIQQRARFFGYKADYLGLCRVYLETIVRDAFVHYVQHEREMLKTLKEIEVGDDSLKSWKRRFFLDPSMRPTRASVIGIDTIRVKTVERWIADAYPIRDDALSLDRGAETVASVLGGAEWASIGHGHLATRVTVSTALELLESLEPESYLGEEAARALQFALARLSDENSDSADVAVIRMRPDSVSKRTEREAGGIQIFQGRSPSGDQYPGDREIYDDSATVTVQLHQVEVFSREDGQSLGSTWTSAWRLSDTAGGTWLVQVGT